jgi:AraC-like DNA-binding protein
MAELLDPEPGPDDDQPFRLIVRDGAADTRPHYHACGQLLYPENGSTLLQTGGKLIRMAADRAAWIPAGVSHAVLNNRTRYHTFYIDERLYPTRPVAVLNVSPLLRALLLDVQTWTTERIDESQRRRKIEVILDELNRAQQLESGVRIPTDPLIEPVCRALHHDPADARSLQMWAEQSGTSEKTLHRRFVAETGLSFQQWRTHVRMTRALELHAQGRRQLDIAVAVGYATDGAYAQAFKKHYGHPPSALRNSPIRAGRSRI